MLPKKQHCINRDRNAFQFSIDFKSDLSQCFVFPTTPKQFCPNAVHNHEKKDDSKVCCRFYHCSPQNSSAETGNSAETLTRPPDYSSSWHTLHRHGLCFTTELSTVALDFTMWPDAEGKARWPQNTGGSETHCACREMSLTSNKLRESKKPINWSKLCQTSLLDESWKMRSVFPAKQLHNVFEFICLTQHCTSFNVIIAHIALSMLKRSIVQPLSQARSNEVGSVINYF